MGYRFNLHKINKTDLAKVIKCQTKDELKEFVDYEYYEDDLFLSIYTLGEPLYCLGKPLYDDYLSMKRTNLEPVFKGTTFEEEYANKYGDYEILYFSKDDFKELIEEGYVERTTRYLRDEIIGDIDISSKKQITYTQEQSDRLLSYVINQWIRSPRSVNLDEDKDFITSSWDRMFGVFELVRLYKTIDWDNEQLLIVGW